MTDDEYRGKSNLLQQELRRIIGILDLHAERSDKGLTSDDAPLILQTRNDLANVLDRFEQLDREFLNDENR